MFVKFTLNSVVPLSVFIHEWFDWKDPISRPLILCNDFFLSRLDGCVIFKNMSFKSCNLYIYWLREMARLWRQTDHSELGNGEEGVVYYYSWYLCWPQMFVKFTRSFVVLLSDFIHEWFDWKDPISHPPVLCNNYFLSSLGDCVMFKNMCLKSH